MSMESYVHGVSGASLFGLGACAPTIREATRDSWGYADNRRRRRPARSGAHGTRVRLATSINGCKGCKGMRRVAPTRNTDMLTQNHFRRFSAFPVVMSWHPGSQTPHFMSGVSGITN